MVVTSDVVDCNWTSEELCYPLIYPGSPYLSRLSPELKQNAANYNKCKMKYNNIEFNMVYPVLGLHDE